MKRKVLPGTRSDLFSDVVLRVSSDQATTIRNVALTSIFADALELLKIKPSTPAAQPSLSSTPTINNITSASDTKRDFAHVEVDDEELPPKKIKTESTTHDHGARASVKCVPPHPRIKPEMKREPDDSMSTGIASTPPTPQANPQAPVEHTKTRLAPILIEDEDDAVQIVNTRSASLPKPTEDHEQLQLPVTTTQRENQAERERKKTLLKMRLAEMKIERELFELGG